MKKLSAFMLLLASVLPFSSCKKESADPNAFKPQYDKNTSCSLMVRGHYDNFESLKQEFYRFNKYYPHVQLSYEYDKDHKKNILTALQGDTPPDIFFTYTSTDFASLSDYTEDLSSEELGLDLGCIRDNLLYEDADGKMPYVPIFTTSFGMMVNKNLFKKYSLRIPDTYQELIKVCQNFKNKGVEYPMLGHTSMVLYPLYFPYFLSTIINNPTAIQALNTDTANAGQYVRSSLELAKDFMDRGFVDKEECSAIGDDYNKTILRFFEGDVPMMLAKGNTFSGTEKRETQSENFSKHPFKYSFVPVPSTERGGYCYNTVELCFSVNKQSQNRQMANEFMRFLLSSNGKELNKMSQGKRMMTACKDLSYDTAYSAFNSLDEDRFFAPSQFGLLDAPDQQVRKAANDIVWNGVTVDVAISKFGTY